MLPVSKRYLHQYILATQIVLMTFFCLLYLGKEGFWFDEVRSVLIARDGSTMWQTIKHHEGNMWLYYVLLHFWMKVGESEFWIRGLSALFGIMTLPVIFKFGKYLAGSWCGHTAVFLMTFNLFFLRYAREARSYSMLIFFATLSSYLFLLTLKEPRAKSYLRYGAASLAMLYSHLFGIFLLIAQGLYLIIARSSRRLLMRFALSGAGIALFCLPLLLNQPADKSNLDWVSKPSIAVLYRMFQMLSGQSSYLFLIYLLLIYFALRNDHKDQTDFHGRDGEKQEIFLLIWLVFPILVTYFISIVARPIFVSRYLTFCIPPIVLLGAVGLTRLKDKTLRAGLLCAITLLTLPALIGFYRGEGWRGEGWKEAAAYVSSHAVQGDPILFFSYSMQQPFEYYLKRLDVAPDLLKILPYASASFPMQGDGGRLPDPDRDLLRKITGQYNRVWLVLSHHRHESIGRREQSETIITTLKEGYQKIEPKRFPGIQLVLFEGQKTSIK